MGIWYVCMYIWVYMVCKYVCMYVCMYVYIWVYMVCMYVCMYIYGYIYGMYVCMMYVCIAGGYSKWTCGCERTSTGEYSQPGSRDLSRTENVIQIGSRRGQVYPMIFLQVCMYVYIYVCMYECMYYRFPRVIMKWSWEWVRQLGQVVTSLSSAGAHKFTCL